MNRILELTGQMLMVGVLFCIVTLLMAALP